MQLTEEAAIGLLTHLGQIAKTRLVFDAENRKCERGASKLWKREGCVSKTRRMLDIGIRNCLRGASTVWQSVNVSGFLDPNNVRTIFDDI